MVFVGTIVAVDPPLPQAAYADQRVQVRVEKSFKGTAPDALINLNQT